MGSAFLCLLLCALYAHAWDNVVYPAAFTTNGTQLCSGLEECGCQTRVNNDLTLTLVKCNNLGYPEVHLKEQGIQRILPGAFELLTDLRILDMTGNLLNTLEEDT